MIDFLIQNWWLAIVLTIVLYLADAYLTVAGARLYKATLAAHLVYVNSYETNPAFAKDIAEFRWLTRKVLRQVLLFVVASVLARLTLGSAVFELWIGFVFLVGLLTLLWRLENMVYYTNSRKPDSVIGRIEFSYWWSQRTSAARWTAQAVLLELVALASGRLFFWGGTIACVASAVTLFVQANRKFLPPSSASAPQDLK